MNLILLLVFCYLEDEILKKVAYRTFIELTNKKWSSLLIKKFVQSRLSSLLIPTFIKTYKIKMEEVEGAIGSYKTLHDFFIRKLKKGARPIHFGQHHVISPVDGVLASTGIINDKLVMNVKGKDYSITEMLGNREKASSYIGGDFLIFYLSPANYHRIHSPIKAYVLDKWQLGTNSYPVNNTGVAYGKEVFSKNFRMVTELQTKEEKVALVKVGAMFVNSIEYSTEDIEWGQGDEVAYFSFGSTVILLFEKDRFQLSSHISVPAPVEMGCKVGEIKRKEMDESK
jgi:phosphatidylserine decarboxylase